MSNRFFAPGPLAAGECVLTGSEAHHLATVRRFTVGDRVTLFNGDGREYPAEVLAVSKKQVVLTVETAAEPRRELGFPLHVAAAMPKGDRGDFLIEKLTELGVTRFTPLETTRSIVSPKVDKLRQAVIEASKQCGRNVLMEVEAVTPWAKFASRPDLAAHRFVLTTQDAKPLRDVVPTVEGVVLAVGPEGGWADGELERAADGGWQPMSLGPRVLRVETAAVAAAAYFAIAASFESRL